MTGRRIVIRRGLPGQIDRQLPEAVSIEYRHLRSNPPPPSEAVRMVEHRCEVVSIYMQRNYREMVYNLRVQYREQSPYPVGIGDRLMMYQSRIVEETLQRVFTSNSLREMARMPHTHWIQFLVQVLSFDNVVARDFPAFGRMTIVAHPKMQVQVLM